jgi:hypothetical protein
MQGLDIAVMDLHDLARSETGQNFVLDHCPVVRLRTQGFLWQMFGSISFGQICDRRSFAPFTLFARRIVATIYAAAELLGLG